MNETTQQFGFSWPLLLSQVVGILLGIAVLAALALLIWRAARKKQ
jgi:hypothetical protein